MVVGFTKELRAVLSVRSERAVERKQEERFGRLRWMGQIFTAMLAGVCSKVAGCPNCGYGAIDNIQVSNDVAERRSSVRVKEERAARGGWIVNSRRRY